VREAGGRVSDFSGNEKNLRGDEILASSDNVFIEFLENVSKFIQ
jgi:fructose-1,6-bisphosphatase/inositol monophosphatase family enzyme